MTFLQLLKAQTATEHTALEDQLDAVEQFRNRESYVALLKRFFTLYEPLEKELGKAADWQSLGWNFEARRKTLWLETDLRALGLEDEELRKLPFCADMPTLHGDAQAIGCLYVVEGATLGGQLISRLLEQSLQIAPDQGGRFFAGYQNQTGAKWKEFGEWAEAWAARHPQQWLAAVDAARNTFASFSGWLN